ncbi:MAG TPA: hypothetical protein VFP73_01330 [Terrabacter sp.]|nr:hypothetical protein [Terrabacter sp.]
MSRRSRSCGLTVEVEAGSGSWRHVVDRALGEGPQPSAATWGSRAPGVAPDVIVRVDPSREPFPVSGLATLTRGAWADGRRVVLTDACGSGLDLLVEPSGERLTVTARPRPGMSHRALRLAAPGRTELLWRAALMQYPALWWAGVRGAVPLHVSAARVGDEGVVIAGPGGVGKSTLLGSLTSEAGAPVSDNLCTYEGDRLHALPEPRRVDAGRAGRLRPTMPHGRVERPWEGREPSVRPSLLLVLRRGTAERPTVRPVSPETASRALVTGTYAAGELRRYWAFAATLALGTGLGPAHPAVVGEAERLARCVPCVGVVLPAHPGTSLAEIVDLARRIERPPLAEALPETVEPFPHGSHPTAGAPMTGVPR